MAKNICFALLFLGEALIAWLYLEQLFERRKKFGTISAVFAAGYFILFAASFADNTALNVLSFFVVNYILIRVTYRCGTKIALVHAAFLSFLMTIAEILIALLISLFGHEFAAYTYDFSVMVALVVMSKMLYLAMALICARIFKPHKQSVSEPRRMGLYFMMPMLSTLLGIAMIYIGSQAQMTPATGLLIAVNVFSLLAVNLIFLVLYNQFQRVSDEHLALQLSRQKEKADASHYQFLQEQYENQRIMIHDIRNHMNVIGSMAKEANAEGIEDYLSRMDALLHPTAQAKLCSDPILNVILLEISDKCQSKGIELQCDVRAVSNHFLDAPSTTALYGNLLSNALEAAELSADKYIEFSIACNSTQSAIIVSVINSCDAVPETGADGILTTRKKDRIMHGIGLKSIERIINKHQGISSIYYDEINHRFHHIIHFPYSCLEP